MRPPTTASPRPPAPPAPGRRRLLQAGTLGLLGLGGAGSSASRADSAVHLPGFGRAKRCILLFMWGGPSQLDTFDPKPDAPAEVRGDFQAIATSTPGLHVSEHFRQVAAVTDKLAVIRSLTHDDPAHLSSAHTILTGHLPPVNKSDAVPPSDRDTPHLGAMLARLRPAPDALPPFVTMPWITSHPAAPGGRAPGQHGGWLGHTYDPLLVTGDPGRPDWKVPALELIDGVSTERLGRRRELLAEIDRQRAALERADLVGQVAGQQQDAFRLLTAPSVRAAFDLARESDDVRDRYGLNTHGQCVLLARRLVESGVPVVSVNWHDDGQFFWDTHGNNFNRLKHDLIPPADRALAALLADLDQRGLLDETIVAWVGEFGRRPRISQGNAGREHWPYCYSGLLAGGGVRGGAVYGASDSHAAHPASQPVSPHDFAATLLHALGVPPDTTLPDRQGRPHALYAGRPIDALFG